MYVVAPTGLSFACRIFSQSDSKHHFITEGQIAVYLPFTYQMGGNTVIMSREYVVAIDVSAEDNLRFSATADLLAMLTTINAESAFLGANDSAFGRRVAVSITNPRSNVWTKAKVTLI
jgi:hypothetical protein